MLHSLVDRTLVLVEENEVEQVRSGNGNVVTYTDGKSYHQELDHSRSSTGAGAGGATSGAGGGGGGGGNTNSNGSNYVSGTTTSKYQQGMVTTLAAATRQPHNTNHHNDHDQQLSEMERAHAKYQIEMEMARQKYQAEIEQAASKYQTEIEQARGNVGNFINMKYQQVSADDMDKAREQEVHYKYTTDLDHANARGNGSNTFTEVKYQQAAFRPSPDIQQQQQQQQQNIQVNSYVEYHQSPTPSNTAVSNTTVTGTAPPPPAKKRKKKPIDENRIRKRCVYQRRMWTNPEREAVMRQLGDFLASERLPGKKDIEEALQHEDILATRSWKNVKDFIRNKTSPRIPRRSEEPLPTQVPVVPAGLQQTTTVSGNMVVTTNTLGEMVTIPLSAQTHQHTVLINSNNLGIVSAQQQHIQQQQQQLQQQHQQQQTNPPHQQHHQHQQATHATLTNVNAIAPSTTTTNPATIITTTPITPITNHLLPPAHIKQEVTTKKRRKKPKLESPDGKQRRVIVRRDWSGAEKAAVLHYFSDYINRQKLPGKKEIEECLQKEDILSYRSWRNVKDFVRNTAQAQIKREAIFGTETSAADFELLS